MYLHAYIFVGVYVCMYVHVIVRMFVARQFLWGCKLYHLLHCTQHTHKNKEGERKQQLGKLLKPVCQTFIECLSREK